MNPQNSVSKLNRGEYHLRDRVVMAAGGRRFKGKLRPWEAILRKSFKMEKYILFMVQQIQCVLLITVFGSFTSTWSLNYQACSGS